MGPKTRNCDVAYAMGGGIITIDPFNNCFYNFKQMINEKLNYQGTTYNIPAASAINLANSMGQINTDGTINVNTNFAGSQILTAYATDGFYFIEKGNSFTIKVTNCMTDMYLDTTKCTTAADQTYTETFATTTWQNVQQESQLTSGTTCFSPPECNVAAATYTTTNPSIFRTSGPLPTMLQVNRQTSMNSVVTISLTPPNQSTQKTFSYNVNIVCPTISPVAVAPSPCLNSTKYVTATSNVIALGDIRDCFSFRCSLLTYSTAGVSAPFNVASYIISEDTGLMIVDPARSITINAQNGMTTYSNTFTQAIICESVQIKTNGNPCVSTNYLKDLGGSQYTGIDISQCFQPAVNPTLCPLAFSMTDNQPQFQKIGNALWIDKSSIQTQTVTITANNMRSSVTHANFNLRVYECQQPVWNSNCAAVYQWFLDPNTPTGFALYKDLTSCFNTPAELLCTQTVTSSGTGLVTGQAELQQLTTQFWLDKSKKGEYTITVSAEQPTNYLPKLITLQTIKVSIQCSPPILSTQTDPSVNPCTTVTFEPYAGKYLVDLTKCFEQNPAPTECPYTFTKTPSDVTNLFELVGDTIQIEGTVHRNYTNIVVTATTPDFNTKTTQTLSFDVNIVCPNPQYMQIDTTQRKMSQASPGLPYFLMPPIATQNPLCPVTNVKISEINNLVNFRPDFLEVNAVYNGTDFEVRPKNLTNFKTYNFYAEVTSLGGTTEYFGPFTYEYGCYPDIINATFNADFFATNNLSVFINMTSNAKAQDFYQIVEPSIYPTYCPVLSYVIVDTTVNSEPKSVVRHESLCNLCKNVTLDLIDNNYTVVFNVNYKVKGGVNILSPFIYVQLVCKNTSAVMKPVIQNVTDFKFDQFDPSGLLNFTNIDCTPLACCQMTIHALKGNSSASPEWDIKTIAQPNLNQTSNIVTIKNVSTSTLGKKTIYLQFLNQFYIGLISEEITYTVIHNCRFASLDLLETPFPPNDEKRLKFFPPLAKVETETTSSKVDDIKLNFFTRVDSNMTTWCPLKLEIADVVDARWNTSIKESSWSKVVKFDNYTFTFKKFDEVSEFYMYLNLSNPKKFQVFQKPAILVWITPPVFKDAPKVVSNTAPYFITPLGMYTIDLGKVTKATYSIPLAQIQDKESPKDKISVTLQSQLMFLKYNQTTHSLDVNINGITKQDYRWHDVDIKLTDPEGAFLVSTLKLHLIAPSTANSQQAQFQMLNNTQNLNLKVYKNSNASAWISEVTNQGVVIIGFGQSMFNDTNFTWLNESVVEIYVEPYLDDQNVFLEQRITQFPSLNISNWSLVSYQSFANRAEMQIQLNFTFPQNISTLNGNHAQDTNNRDTLVFAIKENTSMFFYSNSTLSFLNEDSQILKKKIIPQLVMNNLQEQLFSGADTAQEAAQFLIACSMVFSQLQMSVGSNMVFFQFYMRNTQLMMHLPMIAVPTPPNMNYFYQIMISLVTFDWFNQDYFYYLFSFDDEKQSSIQYTICPGCIDLGYTSHNIILLLGSLWLAVMFYFAKLVILILYFIARNCIKKRIRTFETWAYTLIFNDLLVIIVEGYLEFLISGKLNMDFRLMYKSGEKAATMTNYPFLIASLAAPFGTIYVIYVFYFKKKLLHQHNFQLRWDVFLDMIDLKSNTGVWFNMMYLLRRICFVVTVFYMEDLMSMQVLTLYYINLIMITYQGTKPLIGRSLNQQMMFEELFNSLICYSLYLFLVCDLPDQVFFGWGLIYLSCALFAMRLCKLMYYWLISIYMCFKKFYYFIKGWYYEVYIYKQILSMAEKQGLKYKLLIMRARRQKKAGVEINPFKRFRKQKPRVSELPPSELIPLVVQTQQALTQESVNIDTPRFLPKEEAHNQIVTPESNLPGAAQFKIVASSSPQPEVAQKKKKKKKSSKKGKGKKKGKKAKKQTLPEVDPECLEICRQIHMLNQAAERANYIEEKVGLSFADRVRHAEEPPLPKTALGLEVTLHQFRTMTDAQIDSYLDRQLDRIQERERQRRLQLNADLQQQIQIEQEIKRRQNQNQNHFSNQNNFSQGYAFSGRFGNNW